MECFAGEISHAEHVCFTYLAYSVINLPPEIVRWQFAQIVDVKVQLFLKMTCGQYGFYFLLSSNARIHL